MPHDFNYQHCLGIFPDFAHNPTGLQSLVKLIFKAEAARTKGNHLLMIEVPDGEIGQWNWPAVRRIEQLLQSEFPISPTPQDHVKN